MKSGAGEICLMNTKMHGRKARRVEFMDGPTGNPGIWDDSYGQRIELSATYHGDRDEFWLVLRDAEGNELERRRAATVERIVWMEPISDKVPDDQPF